MEILYLSRQDVEGLEIRGKLGSDLKIEIGNEPRTGSLMSGILRMYLVLSTEFGGRGER